MSGLAMARRTRVSVTGLFIVLLLVNVIFLTFAFIAASGSDGAVPVWTRLSDDAPVGVRLLLLVIGAAGSWFSARILFKMLVRDGVPPSDSVGPAFSLVSYLMLILAAYAFFSYAAWAWLPLLLLIALVWSIVALWSLVGTLSVVGALVIAVSGGVLAWLALS